MDKVVSLKSTSVNQDLILILKELLEKAEKGEIRSFVGTSFLKSQEVVTIRAIHSKDDIFKLLGTVVNLQRMINDEIEEGEL